MKLSSFFITLLVLVALLAGCKGSDGIKINGERPKKQSQSLAVAPLESRIVLSAKIDLQKIREPIKLSSAPDAWLRIGPKAISFSKIHTQGNILRANLSIVANMEAVLGKRPKPLPPSSLTEVGVQVAQGNKSVLRLPIILEYVSLKRELKKVLKIGQKWAPIQGKPNYYWTVKDVEIYPSRENLVVGIDFIADSPRVNGSVTAYMIGKPVIDNEQRIVRVKNPDFIVERIDGMSSKIFLWFGQDQIRKELVSALSSYPFGDIADRRINEVNRKLNRDFGNGVKSQGTLNYKKVDKVVMLENGIYLGTILEGKLEITFGM